MPPLTRINNDLCKRKNRVRCLLFFYLTQVSVKRRHDKRKRNCKSLSYVTFRSLNKKKRGLLIYYLMIFIQELMK
ncbi:hypothetical protein Hdeb2414_s0972g00969791 [Helianthus debilis subsp. tardiflorus]